MRKGKWVVSNNEELFADIYEFDTKDEAVASWRLECEDEDCAGFYVGQIGEHIPKIDKFDVNRIIEQLQQNASDEVWELADEFLEDVTYKEMELIAYEMNVIFRNILGDKIKPNFYPITNVEFVQLGEECNDEG